MKGRQILLIDVTHKSTMNNFLHEIRNLPKTLQQVIAIAAVTLTSLSGAGIYAYLDLKSVSEEQYSQIEQLSDDVSALESELSLAENELEWLRQDVDELSTRLDSLCITLRISFWC